MLKHKTNHSLLFGNELYVINIAILRKNTLLFETICWMNVYVNEWADGKNHTVAFSGIENNFWVNL